MIGNKIYVLRKVANLSQNQLAEDVMANVDYVFYRKKESRII